MGTNLMRALLLTSASVAMVATAAPTVAYAQEATYQINIPAQSMGDALRALGKATKQNIVFNGSVVKGKRSAAVRGQMSAGEALERMLQGSGLEMSRGSGGGLVVKAGNGQSDGVDSALSTGMETEGGEEAIVVTGTHIKSATNSTNAVISFGRRDIEQSGQGTTQDFLAQLPQNFSGGGQEGASETGIFGQGSFKAVNAGSQSGVDLRGLGSRATLTLINGRRIAPAAQGFITADISMIPLSAVERIDVLADGASAIYGADAVGGVVNVILRKRFDGLETRARYGFSSEGGAEEFRFGQGGGASWSTGSFFLAGEYYDRTKLSETDRLGFTDPASAGRANLLPDVERLSLVGHIENEVTPSIKLFVDGIFARSENHNFQGQLDPFETNEFKSNSSQHSITAGIEYALGGGWSATFSGLSSYSSLNAVSDLINPDGSVFQNVKSKTGERFNSVDFLLTGGLIELPAGDFSVAIGASHAWSEFYQDASITFPDIVLPITGKTQRRVASVFGEMLVPLIGSDMRIPLIDRLEVSVAARYDHYSDFGRTFNPKIGAAWSPFSDFFLRGSYSTSFRAPNSFERVGENNGIVDSFIEAFQPVGGGGDIPVLVLSGSKVLGPETSRNYSVGGTYEPGFLPGFSVGLTWYDIRFQNRIEAAPFTRNALNIPALAPFVIDLQSSGSAEALVDTLIAAGGQFNNFFPGSTISDVMFGYDLRTQNMAIVRTSGLDLNLSYQFDLGQNHIGLRSNIAHTLKLDSQAAATAPLFERVDTLGSPVDWRGRGTVSWSNGPWSAAASINYIDGYRDETGTTVIKVNSLTTFDLSASVDLGEATQVPSFRGLTVRLSGTNIFNVDAPFANNEPSRAAFDPAYYDVRRRFVAFELIKRW